MKKIISSILIFLGVLLTACQKNDSLVAPVTSTEHSSSNTLSTTEPTIQLEYLDLFTGLWGEVDVDEPIYLSIIAEQNNTLQYTTFYDKKGDTPITQTLTIISCNHSIMTAAGIDNQLFTFESKENGVLFHDFGEPNTNEKGKNGFIHPEREKRTK